ncbi:MAG TPA: glycoside hydrolase, partial [Thermoanaerobaculia bacterium]
MWKTTDAGRVWKPIFDGQPTQSIGALAVAPSDPKVIYVGSGEGLQRPDLSVGDGVYKSTDGGATWTHLGLADGQQIAALLVDPRDANRVFAAVVGHPYGANAERGVFRSTDGGATWQKVLYKDEDTGAVDLAFDPSDPRTIYADLWAARQAPWEIGGSWNGPGSGLYKSTDGGTTWARLEGGLPTYAQGLGRIGIGVAPSRPARVFAEVEADEKHGGLYRSDDGGKTFQRVNAETRVWGRGGDFAEVKVDPKNPDVVYVANTSTYRSEDGGVTFTAWKGAPGGDDYHRLWIDPDHPEVVLLASDQGAVVTVNGGQTWSSWYNQPTAQFYHVATDDRFPYWVYGGQQESGSAGVVSRGTDGQITFRDWRPVGAEEYGYVAPDPLHPNLIFGGKVQRFDWTTGDVQDVSPEPVRSGKVRYVRTLPLVFSPADPHTLYFGASVLFKTTDGGNSWQTVSPDLTREKPEVPAVLGTFAKLDPQHGDHRGVIYTVAPSPKDVNLIWAGTDDGLIHLTRDGGGHWQNVTPKELTSWSKVSMLEASHFDAGAAYAAINRFRLDDLAPHAYRTHDHGATWTEIVRGIPRGCVVNAVREDPVRRGLLYAATERGVFASWNDGDDWQPLQRNLPTTAVRDLVVHGDDLVVGTHGRGFWILDDVAALREF